MYLVKQYFESKIAFICLLQACDHARCLYLDCDVEQELECVRVDALLGLARRAGYHLLTLLLDLFCRQLKVLAEFLNKSSHRSYSDSH